MRPPLALCRKTRYVRPMQSVAAYFDVADSSALHWAHRVNTAAKLQAALADASLHVLEADIHFGPADAAPQVAEPGEHAEFDVATLIAAAATAGKALKLDFQSPAAIEPTLSHLRQMAIETPVILHTEIFSLLAAANPAEGMEPEQFIRLCHLSCPQAVLSLGWSLKRESDADGRVEEALIEQVSIMLTKGFGPAHYALEIRAGYTSARGAMAEHGAALIFDPLPALPSPVGHLANNMSSNVVPLAQRARRVA